MTLAVAIGAGGAAGGSALSSAGSAGGSSSSSRSGSKSEARDAVALQARLTRLGVGVTGRLVDDANDCAANSYGRVQQYLQTHPCSSLRRAQFEVRDTKGDVALVPVAWVKMPTEAEAETLKKLLDTGGSGNITELSRQRGRYQAIRYTGDAYASRQDGRLVINAQAQPVLRGWTGSGSPRSLPTPSGDDSSMGTARMGDQLSDDRSEWTWNPADAHGRRTGSARFG